MEFHNNQSQLAFTKVCSLKNHLEIKTSNAMDIELLTYFHFSVAGSFS